MDSLGPPPALPATARELLRLWDVNGDPRSVRHASRFSPWSPEQVGEALASAAADFLHGRELQHRDPSTLKDESDALRIGLVNALSRAHVAHDPPRYDEWGCPFKTRFADPVEDLAGSVKSVLVKEFPELFARVADDETAIVYYPRFREFGIPVLDGGPSIITITHDPFSGKVLPKGLSDEWFAAVENVLGRPYAGSLETPAPDEFRSEVWWITRGL